MQKSGHATFLSLFQLLFLHYLLLRYVKPFKKLIESAVIYFAKLDYDARPDIQLAGLYFA